MEALLGIIGITLGYLSIAIVVFSIAFVVAKSNNKKWPYKVALIFSVLFYTIVLIGYLHNVGIVG